MYVFILVATYCMSLATWIVDTIIITISRALNFTTLVHHQSYHDLC